MPQLDLTVISTQIFWLILVLYVSYFLIVYIILPLLYYTLNLRNRILSFQICQFDALQKNLADLILDWKLLYLNSLKFFTSIYKFELQFIKFNLFILFNKIFYFNNYLVLKLKNFFLFYNYKPALFFNIDFKLKKHFSCIRSFK